MISTVSLSRRALLLVTLVVAAWGVLCARLVHVQGIQWRGLREQADRQRSYVDRIPARPGEILDRDGRLLATTITTPSLYVNPRRVTNPWKLALDLARVLEVDADRLFERLARHRDKHFLWIERRLSTEQARRVRQLDLPPETWGFRHEYLRRYPQGTLATHLLGLRDIDGKGRGGVEQGLGAKLGGRDGQRVLVRDALGRVIEVREEVAEAPRHGPTAVLTVDAVVQLYAERALDKLMEKWKPKGACAIVLDPQSAEVLAMASRPAYDPNRPADVPPGAWQNRALSAVYEPGSTLKPFIVAWALEQGAVDRSDVFDCEHGEYRMGPRILHDHHPYGRLSLANVLVKSSNIGMAKIGERLGNERLYEAVVAFGFGRKTGIGLPGEESGLVRPLEAWNRYSTGSVPMGQEIAVTPLQLVTAYAALVNGGRLQSPRVLVEYRDPATGAVASRSEPAVVSRTVSPEVARWIIEKPLVEVVERGTGRRAQLDDYTVFGKTGTAQKIDPETGGYSSTKHVSSFIGGAPAHDPRALVLVVVDEPSVGNVHYGGVVAAPAVARILRKTLIHLGVPPGGDSSEEPVKAAAADGGISR